MRCSNTTKATVTHTEATKRNNQRGLSGEWTAQSSLGLLLLSACAAAVRVCCVQCKLEQHAADAKFCNQCGGKLSDSDLPLTPHEESELSGAYSVSSSAPSIVAMIEAMEPHDRARLDFSTRLWDHTGLVCEKSRMAKHSTKAMAAFYGELAKIERTYATSLQKLAAHADYGAGIESNENKSPLVSNIVRAWNTIKADVIGRGRAHAQFADIAANKIEFMLSELRKKLSVKKEALEAGINDSATKLKQAQESHAKLKARHEKLALELASNGPTKNLTEVEVSMAFDAVTNAQLLTFKMQNAHYRVVSENLGKLQELELERVSHTRSILLLARQFQSQMERKYMLTETAQYEGIAHIDPIAEIMPWVDAHASKNPCPWSSAKAVQVLPPGATPAPTSAASSSSSSSSSAPPIHNRPPTGAALAAGSTAARTAPRSGQRAASNRSASPSSPPTASSPADRKLRSSRHNSMILSPEAVKLIASGSPILAALATAPASAAASLPPQLDLKDLPFPTIGLPKRIEPLPPSSWMPSARALFPLANPATVPDISSLTLSGMEYNKLCYEQLLLSTNCFADLRQPEHREALLAVVRVQLHIPQSEHDLLTRVLTVEQGVLPNSPSQLGAEQRSAAFRQRAAAAAGAGGDDEDTSTLPSTPGGPAPHVAESMMYVNYRLSLLRSVKSGRFPSLPAYRAWFQRQVHAVWLAILWTMQAQVIQAANPANPAHVVAPSAASAASGVAPGTTVSLAAFKHTLQQVQLLSFSLCSKIDTKIFVLGDHVASGAHADILAQIAELETTLHAFPVPYQSVVAESLQYPQLMLNKIYKHVVHVSCIAGGDEFGRPLVREKDDGSASDSDASDVDDDDSISLHPSYLSVLASLSSVRALWKIPEFYQYSLLYLILHVVYFQSLEYDGKLLDADCMLEGDKCILPLLAHVSNAICGHLRPELAAITAASPREQKIKPEQLDDDENAFLCFALRNIGYALSDFQQFAAGPVSVCFQFYHDICAWLGVKDVAARCDAFLRIATTNFYQTSIPTEQVLIMPSFTAGSTAPSTPRKGDHRDGSSGSGAGAAQIQITPKKPSTWSADEWRSFSVCLCTFIVDQIEDFFPAFHKNKALKHVLARGGGGKKSVIVDDDDEASISRPDSGVKKNSAEVCILQLLRCFAQDVAVLNADRKAAAAGMDDTLLNLVSALVRIQTQLMDSGYSDFWSGQAVKAEMATVFPNLADLCSAAINRWLDVQKIKVEGISERCVTTDEWVPSDPDGGLKYSHSVTDLYNFLNTMHEAFWVHGRSLAGYGVADSLESMVGLLNTTLQQYGAHIVESCGLNMLPQIFPSKDVKLKQAKLVPTDKDKAKAFVSGLFKKIGNNKEKEAAMSPNEEEPVAPDLVQKGLVIQTLQSLCVRLCCIEAAIDFSADLSQNLQSHAAAFIADFPIVAPEGGSSSSSKGEHSREAEQSARAARRWQEWSGCFNPPVRLPHMESGQNAFAEAVDQMREQIEQLAEGVGVSLVYVEWRSTWLTKLYAPQPLESTRVRAGDLENKVEDSMPVVHECLTRSLFPIVAKHIFKQIMTAIQYVMLYGRRGIQEEQVKSIITGDIAQLMNIFGKVVSARDLERSTKDIQELCQVMEIPTDDLIAMYNSNKCPLPIPIMARIIAARSGKNAQKLIDKIRGK